MPGKSKSAVLTDARKIEIQEFDLPEISDDDGLLRIEITGVCGADWPVYTGDAFDRTPPPVILGHEIVGHIEKLGSKAALRWGVKEGDRVCMEEYVRCNTCRACITGHYNRCENLVMLGHVSTKSSIPIWGGYAQYLYLDSRAIVYPISEKVPKAVAPLFLPFGNGVRWAQTDGGASIGSNVAILGPGHQGIGCVVAAKEAGASCVIVTGLSSDASRLQIARDLGADVTIMADEEDVVERVREITNGEMCGTVVNATAGSDVAAGQAIEVAGAGGTCVMAGGAKSNMQNLPMDLARRKELTLKGVRGRRFEEVKKSIAILESGKYDLEKVCTHLFSIEETEQALKTVGREGDLESLSVSVLGD
jgi:threonine dehydrogenase-like Zn-dependent dehydrogenase